MHTSWAGTSSSCKITAMETKSVFSGECRISFHSLDYPTSYPINSFSRGAYTARALAGMLTRVRSTPIIQIELTDNFEQVGLLPKDNFEQVSFAYKMYSRTDKDAETQSSSFKQAFSRHVEIEFLGVWCVPDDCPGFYWSTD